MNINQNRDELNIIWDINFVKYIINVLFACGSAYIANSLIWYGSIIAFPAYLFLTPNIIKCRLVSVLQVYIMRMVYLIVGIAFIVIQAVIFQKNIGSWYGWIVGAFLSWIVQT